ncbi:MAG: hypothetical protein ACOCXO_05190 [Bacteroidota bacterium]
MKKIILVLAAFLAIFMLSCQDGEKSEKSESETDEQKTEQEAKASGCCEETVESCDGAITTDKLLAKFEEKSEEMDGEEVSVCGEVTHVCVHSGTRMFLGTSGEEVIIVTSEEKFPEDNMGKKVIVTGKVKLVDDAHQHGDDEEDHEHIDDDQHRAADKSHFEIETIKCIVCECDHSEEA